MLAAIWAQDEEGLIGKDDALPWRLPNDLSFFRNTTENNTIVMGRKTFEGMNKRPLPNRHTIVLTSDTSYQAEGIQVMHTVEEVLAYAESYDGIVFITGGANVYRQFFPHADILYRTVIHEIFEGDTYIPEPNWDDWSMIDISEGTMDAENRYAHTFETYKRKNN
ncbi:dihydrofolate reductase [Vagococcus lutrae]|uniref:dihydrofolate reductase n=1 Tax=Vagococcus lutrae TaxID=81947 RepID=UPI000F8742B5|nr:dihydrofolate reductase [Vagococcus lutrae]RST93263.1 dihydrofolate reductase [Vagococcus lutrae]